MVDAPRLAGSSDRNVPELFEFVDGHIHRFEVNTQKPRNPALPDLDRGPLIGIPRQNAVNATGGCRQALVAEHAFAAFPPPLQPVIPEFGNGLSQGSQMILNSLGASLAHKHRRRRLHTGSKPVARGAHRALSALVDQEHGPTLSSFRTSAISSNAPP